MRNEPPSRSLCTPLIPRYPLGLIQKMVGSAHPTTIAFIIQPLAGSTIALLDQSLNGNQFYALRIT